VLPFYANKLFHHANVLPAEVVHARRGHRQCGGAAPHRPRRQHVDGPSVEDHGPRCDAHRRWRGVLAVGEIPVRWCGRHHPPACRRHQDRERDLYLRRRQWLDRGGAHRRRQRELQLRSLWESRPLRWAHAVRAGHHQPA